MGIDTPLLDCELCATAGSLTQFTIYGFATKIDVKFIQNASKFIRKVCYLDPGALLR